MTLGQEPLCVAPSINGVLEIETTPYGYLGAPAGHGYTGRPRARPFVASLLRCPSHLAGII